MNAIVPRIAMAIQTFTSHIFTKQAHPRHFNVSCTK